LSQEDTPSNAIILPFMDATGLVDTSPGWKKISMILAHVGDKWTIPTITMLTTQPRRFNELKRLIGDGISPQMLTRTLKALDRDGLVKRKVEPTIPPQVEYALTDLGHSLAEPLMQLTTWLLDHIGEIEGNRAAREVESNSAGRKPFAPRFV